MNKEDEKCFQWAVTATLDNEQIKEEPQRIKKIKTVTDIYDLEGKSHSSEKNDWKKIEKNNQIIALNVLFTKKISCLCFKI